MIIYCLSYAHDIMIWITRSLDLHSDNIITTTTTTTTTTTKVYGQLYILFYYYYEQPTTTQLTRRYHGCRYSIHYVRCRLARRWVCLYLLSKL